ncbi:MAG: hypothetical protein M1820_007522 [Bogoriella megaspora]|nr:MAG: hypothetical protein M1820_007522 [Bogoriella megaspora]
MYTSTLFAFAASLSSVSAVYKGFNYGSTFDVNNQPKLLVDFEEEFNNASALVGTSGFTSARLYTMIQANTTNSPIEAIPAAINTQTALLLGLWASENQDAFNNELAALRSAISTYGSDFAGLVAGISVGSEDLYRITPTGIQNNAGVGQSPSVIANYIGQVRNVIANTVLSGAPVGHVDTWTAWVNASNDAVINACDFIGMDAYPYFQTTLANSIENGNSTFWDAFDATAGAVDGKPIWITETGWPVSGPTANQAVASVANAERYWDEVGCAAFGKINTWWFTLQDIDPNTPSPSFGIVGGPTLSTQPLYNLTCPAGTNGAGSQASSSSGSPSASGTATPVSGSGGSSVQVATNTSPGPESSPASSEGSAPSLEPGSSSGSVPGSVPAGSTSTTGSTGSRSRTTSAPSSSTPAPTSSVSVCPTNLNGPFEYPHLIIPIDSANPNKAYGTSYNGTVSSTISSIFNFDIPASDTGKTCSLTFLLPNASQLQTSNYDLSGSGVITFSLLSSTASASTTYANAPSVKLEVGSVDNVQVGSAYHISSDECPAGTAISFEIKATGSLNLNYFQDYELPGIGLYVTVC